jgi:TolB-like protein
VSWLLVCWSVLWLAAGCSQPRPQGSGLVEAPKPLAPESTKVIVLRLENSTKKGKSDKGTGEDRLLGNGVKAQIVTALSQSGRFSVINNSGPREVLQRAVLTENGDLKGTVRDRLGSLGDAEFIVAGTVVTYQLSKDSKKAGVGADLLFREPQAQTVPGEGNVELAKRIFEALKPSGPDRIVYELWVFDARTGKRIAITRIEGTPSDSSETLATPMQQAVRGSVAKVVNWVSDTQTAFRAGTLTPPARVDIKKPLLPEPKPDRVIETRPSKAPVVRPRPMVEDALPKEEVTPKVVETEKIPAPPAAKAPAVKGEDWGSPASQPATKKEKTPTQNAEEWGEQ